MKAKLILAVILVANLLALWWLSHRYEFHSGMQGSVIWRCNKFTGKVEYCVIRDNKWVAISSPKPFVPPPLDSIEEPKEHSQSSWVPPEVLAEERARAKEAFKETGRVNTNKLDNQTK